MCKDRIALYKFFSQDGAKLSRKIMCESPHPRILRKQMLKSSVASNVRPRSCVKVLPPTTESTYSCMCDGLKHNSLVETLP